MIEESECRLERNHESGGYDHAPGVAAWHAPRALSPSLWEDREAPSFEVKFLLSEDEAAALEAWAKRHLAPDPHGDPALDHAYRTHGLYFDTSRLDVFHRSPGYRRKKFRLRRYGADQQIFLEQKRKKGDRVAKRRTVVPEVEVGRLCGIPAAPEDIAAVAWPGHWFHSRISRRQLAPTCQITYDRKAYFGPSNDGPLRLTLDRNARCRLVQDWKVEEVTSGLPLLADRVLLEMKFRSHMPVLFKGLLQDFSLTPRPLSKYRLALQTCGIGATAGRAAHA